MEDLVLIKGMREAIDRIFEAIRKKEKIILYGDADPDGVASVIILKEALEILGNAPFFIYFPNRGKQGYGLNKKALEVLKRKAPALLITLDCGIGNFEEIEIASETGFEVIVIDHHQVLENLPKALIIIDPKQEQDEYPFKGLCTAGIVYKLVKSLFFEAQKEFEPDRFLELAMIATISDQMPRESENKKIIEQGLLCLPYTKRQGLKALIQVSNLKEFHISEIINRIIPCLVSAGSRNYKNEAYLLLTEQSFEKAEKISKFLFKKNKLRKKRIKEIAEQVEKKIDSVLPIIFLGEEDWPLTLTGTIASKLCHQYKKPVFIYNKGKIESQGSSRTPKEIDSVKAMSSCAELLETYGGHAQASGFRVKNKNLENFKNCLISYFNRSGISSN